MIGRILHFSRRLSDTHKRVAVICHKLGDPADVLKLEPQPWPPSQPLGPDDVVLKWLASQPNPSDFNMIEGTYAWNPPVPFVAGSEGVAEVLETGSQVINMAVGDWVLPLQQGLGTWQTYSVLPSPKLIKLNHAKTLGPIRSASIAVNPCTAYRLLRDFVDLMPGDTLIQNGATSQVGQCVIQMAAAMGVHTINIIRESSSEIEKAQRDHLMQLGATAVILPDDVRGQLFADIKRDVGPLRLALNCVMGKPGNMLQRALDRGGVCVTYGGMGKKLLEIGVGSLIFKELRFVGFWISNWNKQNSVETRSAMLDNISQMMMENKVRLSHVPYKLEQYAQAIADTRAPFKLSKPVIVMQEPL